MTTQKPKRGRPKTHDRAIPTYVYLSQPIRERAEEMARAEKRSLSAQLAVLVEKGLAS